MKKFIVFVIMSVFFLCGCMQTEEIDFADMSGSLTVASERELSQKDIECDDSYVIGVSEKTYSGLRQIKERVPKVIPHKILYNNYFIFSCYAFLFIFDFPNPLSKHILQFHSYLFSSRSSVLIIILF